MGDLNATKSYKAGCLRQALIASLILFIVFVGFAGLVALSISLPLSVNQRGNLVSGGTALLLVIIIIGVSVWGFLTVRRRASALDEIFNPIGLIGKSYLWTGRQYHGTWKNRQVDIYFYQGPSLDIYIASPLNTRLSIGSLGRFSQRAPARYNQSELNVKDPSLDGTTTFSLDQRWGSDLLSTQDIKAAILRLVNLRPGYVFRNLLFQPEALQFQVHILFLKELTTETLRTWLDELFSLASAAEALPPPRATATATLVEQRARLNRSGISLSILAISFGILFFFAVNLFLVIIILINLTHSSV